MWGGRADAQNAVGSLAVVANFGDAAGVLGCHIGCGAARPVGPVRRTFRSVRVVCAE